MAYAVTSRGRLSLIGGELCIDFVNTVDWRTGPNPEEYMSSYSDLIDWSQSVGTIDAATARRLKRRAAADPSGASAAFSKGIVFRESLYAILLAVSCAKSSASQSMRDFNGILASLAARAGVKQTGESFEWVWSGMEDDLDRPLWPTAVSAFELLTSDGASRVRQCGDAACGWLFVDNSKSRRRQWCSMKVCGNRAKARRHYEKTKVLPT